MTIERGLFLLTRVFSVVTFQNANILLYLKRLYSKVIKSIQENANYSRFVCPTVKELMNVAAMTEASKLGIITH